MPQSTDNRNRATDVWGQADPYDQFMGRWSRKVAPLFLRWLAPEKRRVWLDVGCGSGALSEVIIASCDPIEVMAIDRAPGFAAATQRRLGGRAMCVAADAQAIPFGTAVMDVTVSGLVLNFVPDPRRALVEMRRTTKPGGRVAVYIWDYAGKMELLSWFWKVVAELDPKSQAMDEGQRFNYVRLETLHDWFTDAGLMRVESIPIEIEMHFRDFDDYWQPFLGGQGPAPSYVKKLDEQSLTSLRLRLRESLPTGGDGSIQLQARVWAVRGET